MEFSDLASLIKSRRSIRSWQQKEVPEDLLLQAIELATWAPNGGNQQNWYFYLIKNRGIIDTIADSVQSMATMIASWPEAREFGDTASLMIKRIGFFRNAPAAIAVAAAQYQSQIDKILTLREEIDPKASEIRRWRSIANSRVQSVSSAIAYLLLVLHQMGLGAVWMTGPLQAKEKIEEILQVPDNMDVIAFIPIGYPAENPATKERKPVQEVCKILG